MQEKINFIAELGHAYHLYGASTQRLEGALKLVAGHFAMSIDIFATPSSQIFHLRWPGGEVQRMQRLPPGEINLEKLVEVDDVADLVLEGNLGVDEASAKIAHIHQKASCYGKPLVVLSFGVLSAMVAMLFPSTRILEVLFSLFFGSIIGLFTSYIANYPRFRQIYEVVSGFGVAFFASLCKIIFPDLKQDLVIISSLVVLLPGLPLTLSMIELSNQELISGTARFMAAVTSFLKLAFGVALGTGLMHNFFPDIFLGESQTWGHYSPFSAFTRTVVAPFIASLCICPIFRAHPRDRLWVVMAAFSGHQWGHWGQVLLGPQLGVFVAGLLVSALSHALARPRKRPISVLLLPGMILIVPGMLGYRGLQYLFQSEILSSMDWAFKMIIIGVSLVVGLLCGAAVVPSKRFL